MKLTPETHFTNCLWAQKKNSKNLCKNTVCNSRMWKIRSDHNFTNTTRANESWSGKLWCLQHFYIFVAWRYQAITRANVAESYYGLLNLFKIDLCYLSCVTPTSPWSIACWQIISEAHFPCDMLLPWCSTVIRAANCRICWANIETCLRNKNCEIGN